MANLFLGSISKTSKFESAVWVTKLGLISVGIMTTLILFKVAIVPFSFDLLTTLPGLHLSLHRCLSLPYIYVILNSIILIIAFSSIRSNQSTENQPHSLDISLIKTKENTYPSLNTWQPEETLEEEEEDNEVISSVLHENSADPTLDFSSSIDKSSRLTFKEVEEEEEEEEEKEENQNDTSPPQESMDETWKLIMERKRKSPTRQQKKSEIWDSPPRVSNKATGQVGQLGKVEEPEPFAWDKRELRKSDTFNGSVSLREMSMSLDEFNRKVEAFINRERRLQRQ